MTPLTPAQRLRLLAAPKEPVLRTDSNPPLRVWIEVGDALGLAPNAKTKKVWSSKKSEQDAYDRDELPGFPESLEAVANYPKLDTYAVRAKHDGREYDFLVRDHGTEDTHFHRWPPYDQDALAKVYEKAFKSLTSAIRKRRIPSPRFMVLIFNPVVTPQWKGLRAVRDTSLPLLEVNHFAIKNKKSPAIFPLTFEQLEAQFRARNADVQQYLIDPENKKIREKGMRWGYRGLITHVEPDPTNPFHSTGMYERGHAKVEYMLSLELALDAPDAAPSELEANARAYAETIGTFLYDVESRLFTPWEHPSGYHAHVSQGTAWHEAMVALQQELRKRLKGKARVLYGGETHRARDKIEFQLRARIGQIDPGEPKIEKQIGNPQQIPETLEAPLREMLTRRTKSDHVHWDVDGGYQFTGTAPNAIMHLDLYLDTTTRTYNLEKRFHDPAFLLDIENAVLDARGLLSTLPGVADVLRP